MKKLLLVLLLVGVLLFTGCTQAVTTTQLNKAVADLKAEIAAVSGKVSSIEERVGALESRPAGTTTDLTGIRNELNSVVSELDTLFDTLADIESRMDELEVTEEEEEEESEFLTTRWQPTVDLESSIATLKVVQDSISWYPTRIKDEDTYRISFDIVNNTGTEQRNQVLVIALIPSSRDTSIDTANTGIYSVSPIRIWWDAEYSPSSGVGCRGIEFISDRFDIPVGTMTVKVDFDLYYK